MKKNIRSKNQNMSVRNASELFRKKWLSNTKTLREINFHQNSVRQLRHRKSK